MIVLLAGALAQTTVEVGPTSDLEQILSDTPGTVVLNMATGVYGSQLDLDGRDVVFQAAAGALPVFGAVASAGDEAQIILRGGRTSFIDVAFAPLNMEGLRLSEGASVTMVGGSMRSVGVGRSLSLNGATVRIRGTSFTGGVASMGGQILVLQGELDLGPNTSLEGGEAVDGGLVYIAPGAVFSADGVTFSVGVAERGGALFCGGDCQVVDARFTEGRAGLSGGAVHATPGAFLVLDGVDLFENVASNGGALFSDMATGRVLRSTFCANQAVGGGEGGGMRVVAPDGEEPTMELGWLRFLHNEAVVGGGLHLRGPADLHHLSLHGNGALFGSAVFGEGELRRSLLGYNRGGFALQPENGGALEALGSELFANDGGTHPTTPYAQVEPMLRDYRVGEPCGQHNDYFAAGSEPVLESRETIDQRPRVERGAYSSDGIATGDEDGDGWDAVYDCDDRNAAIFPRVADRTAPYVENDVNCDGTNGLDRDGDGFDVQTFGGTDCDDDNPLIRPGVPDGDPVVDLNCNGFTEEEAPVLRSTGCSSSGLSTGAFWMIAALLRRRVTLGGRHRRPREHPIS